MAGIEPPIIEINKPKELQEKMNNLENILDKLSSAMDVGSYLKEFNKIRNEISNGASFSIDTIEDSFPSIESCIKRIDELQEKIEKELMPFYHMHLLQKSISSKLKDKEKGIDEVISKSLELIEIINNYPHQFLISKSNIDIHVHTNREDLQEIYDRSIETLYQVIVYEQIYDRDLLIKEILSNPRNGVIKEKIVKYLMDDLRKVKKNNIINEELQNINKGLSYDLLSTSIIDEIIEANYSSKREEYLKNKEEARANLKKRIFEYQEDKKELEDNGKNLKSTIRNIRLHRGFDRARLLSYVLVPVIAIGGGLGIGRLLSNNIDEYRTITRTVNPVTQEVVETISDVYDEHENTYTATVKVYGPWEKSGSVYTRSVYAYNYDSNIDYSNIDNNQTKYHYTEAKESLSSSDSTTESTVLITETIQDKNDTRKSSKFVIPLAITAGVLSIIAEIIRGVKVGTYDIEEELRKLKKQLKEKKLVRKNLDDEKIELENTGSIIRKDCETSSAIYQFSEDEFSTIKVIKKTW